MDSIPKMDLVNLIVSGGLLIWILTRMETLIKSVAKFEGILQTHMIGEHDIKAKVDKHAIKIAEAKAMGLKAHERLDGLKGKKYG